MKSEPQETAKPWYKEPLMLLVLGIPFLAVIWGGVILSLALSTKDSLVSDSYYKDGVSYTENQEAFQAASRLQAQADLIFTNDEVRLQLRGYFDEKPNTLQLQLIHPTLEDRDLTVFLQKMTDGSYAGVNDMELPDRRRLWLSSPEQGWQIRSTELIMPEQTVTLSYQ
ncbi:FixH family protein [Bacterioplanes sanyensis]|nr:FixH family protein [Bacterioplanes sanyensis]